DRHQRMAGHAGGERRLCRARAGIALLPAQDAGGDLSSVDPALLLLGRAPRLRLRLARGPRRRSAPGRRRRRLWAAPGLRPDPDRPGLRMDHRADRHDAGDRGRPAAAARAAAVSLAAGRQDVTAGPGLRSFGPAPRPRPSIFLYHSSREAVAIMSRIPVALTAGWVQRPATPSALPTVPPLPPH